MVKLNFENLLFLAPLAGYTDLPFRSVVKRFGVDVTVSEMISSHALVHAFSKTAKMLERSPEEKPFSVQIAGSKEQIVAEAVEKINALEGIDIIDFNCGCPAPKVANHGNGSGLLKDLNHLVKLLRLIKDKSNKPYSSVKVRLGFESKIPLEIAHALNDAPVDFVVVHARTRADRYKKERIDYESVRLMRQVLNKPLIANGEIDSPKKAKEVLAYTGANGVMIGRSSLTQPWIFWQIKNNTEDLPAVLKKDLVLEHFDKMVSFYGERGVVMFRKNLHAYAKGHANASVFKTAVNNMKESTEARAQIEEFFQHAHTPKPPAPTCNPKQQEHLMLKKFLLVGLAMHPLCAVKNHIFTGARFGMAQNFKSTFANQLSMSNPSTLPDNNSVYACPDNLCKNNEIVGFYKPSSNKSANFAFTYTLGDELFFDKFGISGIRFYGDIEYANANLGRRYKVQNKGGLNYNPQNIKAIDSATGQVIPTTTTDPTTGQVTYSTPQGYSSPCAALTSANPLGLCPTPTPQEVLLSRPAHMVTLGLNVDVFLNLPIDIWLRKRHPKMMFFKMGIFVGGGVEYAMLWSDNFNNQALSALGGNSLGKGHIDKTRFFAAGNGFYVNVGYQLYLGQHNRFNLGWKLPYYSITAHNWYNYGNTNPGTQQTIKQTLSITRQSQFYVSYAYLF